ncbi:MAG: cation:proton antiporter [Nanoarchaeota archaeon]
MVFSVQIGLIILFSLVGSLLASRFRQPTVIGLLIAGAIVGPHALGIVNDPEIVESAIELGAILLLFTIGIEFSIKNILNLGARAVLIGAIKISIVLLLSYYAALFMGASGLEAIFFGIILSITSTVIVIKVMEQKGLAKKEELPLLITILILEDIFGVFALAFISGLNTHADLNPIGILTKLAVSLALLVFTYLILQRLAGRAFNWIAKYSSEDTATFTSLSLCGIMAYVATLLSLSPSVGAFLAGNIIASFPNSKSFEKAIHPFLLTFTSLFFFSVGTAVNFASIIFEFRLILVLFAVSVIVKFITIGAGSYIFTNFNGKQAAFSGIAMISIGEFSLLIAKEANAVGSSMDFVSITASIILLSTITMSLMISNTGSVYRLTTRLIPKKMRENMDITSKYINSISWAMVRDRVNLGKIKSEFYKILNNMTFVFVFIALVLFLWRYFHVAISSLLRNDYATYFTVIAIVAILYIPVSRIIKNAAHLNKDLFRFFVKISPKELQFDTKIFRKIRILSLLFIAMIVFPQVFLFFRIPVIYNALVVLIFLIITFNALMASNMIHDVVHKHEKDFGKSDKGYVAILKKKMKKVEKERIFEEN